LTSVQ